MLDAVCPAAGLKLTATEYLAGGAAIDATGAPLPEATLAGALAADAVLLGAVGGPKWDGLPYATRPERALLGLRKALAAFANLRPVRLYDALVDASTLRPEVVRGVDLVVVRELVGGLYFGEPRGITGDRGVNTMVYTVPEIERIARAGFRLARGRRKLLHSIDKANVLETTELWRKVVTRLGKDEFPDIKLEHMLVDNCAMQLVRNPRQFDVVLTENLFGDILSDEAAMLTGSIGMLSSASVGEADSDGRVRGIYEPVHGSAPDIAGQDKANPLAAILSAALLLRYSAAAEAPAARIEAAVEKVLASGLRTGDLARPNEKPIGTRAMGDAVLAAL